MVSEGVKAILIGWMGSLVVMGVWTMWKYGNVFSRVPTKTTRDVKQLMADNVDAAVNKLATTQDGTVKDLVKGLARPFNGVRVATARDAKSAKGKR